MCEHLLREHSEPVIFALGAWAVSALLVAAAWKLRGTKGKGLLPMLLAAGLFLGAYTLGTDEAVGIPLLLATFTCGAVGIDGRTRK